MIGWKKIQSWINENQILVILLALIAGLVFPTQFRFLNHYSTQLLITVFFASSLRLSLHEVVSYAKDWRLLLLSSAFMLVVLPFALFYPFLLLSKEWAIALLIFGAMPTGMTIALVADFFGGKTSLALLIATATSLLAPFTIPLVSKIAIGQFVPIPVSYMMISLVLTIVLPFFLAMLVKRAVPRLITNHDEIIRHVSVLAFAILIAGIVADTSYGSFTLPTWQDAAILVLFTIWMGLLTWASYSMVTWRNKEDRITVALSMIYLNNTLALFVANRFFASQNILPKLILLLLVINLLLPPIKWYAAKLHQIPHRPNRNPAT
jgi:bile acid:Na+ symporter, BASS family